MRGQRFYYLTFWVAAVLALSLCSSCGTFKKTVHKSEEKVKTTIETKKDESANTASVGAVSRTITEEATIPFIQPADSAQATGTQETLDKGEPILFEDDDFLIETKKDSSTGIIKTKVLSKPKTHQLPGKKTIQEHLNSIFTTTATSHIDQKVKQEKVTEEKVVDKDRKTGVNWTLIWIVGIALFLLLIAFFIWFYLPRRRRSK